MQKCVDIDDKLIRLSVNSAPVGDPVGNPKNISLSLVYIT